MSGRDARRRASRRNALKRWGIGLLLTVVALVILWVLFVVFVGIATTDMWFDSVHHGSVYTTMLEARVVLFCVFGAVAGIIGGLTVLALHRLRAPLYVSPDDDTFRWTFRRFEPRVWRLLLLLAVVIPAVRVGQQAAAGWQTYLLWLHAVPWHSTDPQFHKDISFFVEVNPFHVMVLGLLSQAITYCVWIAVIGGYWYGGWRIRGGRRKVTSGMTRLVSLIGAGYLLIKAINYWVSRYAITTSSLGPVTGPSATGVNATLPSKYVLLGFALVGAAVLLANAVLAGRVRTLAATALVMVVVSTLAGAAWPGLYYRFREAPSAASVDLSEIAHNQKATLSAYGLDGDVTTTSYSSPTTSGSATELAQLATTTAQIPVIDPNQLSPTFIEQQQQQAYYTFKSTLDLAHYPVGGRDQDVAIAVRELRSVGIPQSSWVNTHLVYTHGYGIVAAPTTSVDPTTESPDYLNGGLPPTQDIPVTRPQIYFGQSYAPSSYAIVGQPKGSSTQLEFDHPGSKNTSAAHTTYQGDGGVPIGSTLRRLLFAVQMGDPNILFSSEINSASQLLEVRNPAARVAKVAPWLTLDGDVYPAIVDGEIKWIVDGYTTTSSYPGSQQINLGSASNTTLVANGASVGQSGTVNYFRNSVKAVVDAYTGQVSLYSWDQQQHPDPLLQAWEAVYPGLVQPESSIPSALMSQLRYPTDLFDVQRYVLAKYHVTGAANFYSGNDFWTVPSDPTTSTGINSGGGSSAPQPPRYASMANPASGGPQQYSLSSPMVTLNGRQLAAFVYVNSVPGPDYGKFTVVKYSSGSGGESPLQVQNDIESDSTISRELTLERGGNSQVVLGDMVAIPVAGRLLYVEPVYTQSSGSSSFPILRHVIALYANGDPSFAPNLPAAVKEAIASGAPTG